MHCIALHVVQVAKWKRNSRVDLSPPRCYGPPPPQVDPVGGCTASNANITCQISCYISCQISCYICAILSIYISASHVCNSVQFLRLY